MSLYIQMSEEEEPAGHVMEGFSPSTVTEKMSGDVDPADHVPDSGPPPQITDQISAVSHISLMSVVHLLCLPSTTSMCVILWGLRVTVTDLSTIPFLPPQDEEYARQLQSELYAMSDVQDRPGQISAVSHISHV